MVTISFTNKEAEQIKRSLEFTKMLDGDADSQDSSKRMEVISHRAFIQQILEKIYHELEKQLV